MEALEARGDLVRIRLPIDPFLEITEIADRVMKQGGPALLFENVRGSRFPLAINAFGSRERVKLALGVDHLECIGKDFIALLKSIPLTSSLSEKFKLLLQLSQIKNYFPKVISGKAPCQEIVMEKPDLDTLPILTCWPQDGGPFITLPVVITKDPETGVRNCGVYRLQKLSSTTTGMHWQLHKDGKRIYDKHKARGEKIEAAVSLGGDPVLTYVATAPMLPEIDELMFAGFIKQKPVELVKGITINIEVPASADFIIEGYIDPQEELRPEGPFGDHTGFYTPRENFPVFHITCITHRKNPVYPATIVGVPPRKMHFWGGRPRIFLPFLTLLYPEIVDLHLPIEGGFHNLAIVSIKKTYPGREQRLCSPCGEWGR